MLKHVRAWALALATLSLAPMAHAACTTPTLTGLTGKDASLNVQTMATLTQSSQQMPLHVDSAFNGTLYAPLTSDASCYLNVDIQAGSVSLTGTLPGFASTPTFTLSGTLPAYASTPTFNLGALNGAATAANQPALNGDGGALAHVTNFPATQPVSATSLPLPAGAATAADQTNVQSAPGTSASTAVTVQGSASGVALPISGSVSVSNFPATQPVSGTVTANAGSGTFGAQDTADAAVTAGTAPAKAQLGAVQYNSSAPTLTTGQTVAAQGDVNGNLKVNCVSGCSGGGGGAVTIASGGVVSGAYVLGAIADLGASGQLHTDLQALNTTAGNPAKLVDSGGGDVSDPTNHALLTEVQTNGRFVQAPASVTTTSATSLVAAQGAGNYTYITDLDCENSGQYTFTLTLTNAASTSLYTLIVPAGGGWTKNFSTPLGGNGQMATNTAISVTATQVGGTGQTPSIVCNVQGRVRSN